MSRAQIVNEATKVVAAGRYKDMTIRSLAAELGVAPMSLYRHVRDKDDLLDEVVDRLLARSWKPRADDSDLRAWVAKAAEKLCTFLIAQPAALHVYLNHPVVSPAAIARMQAMMDVLRQMGADEHEARRAYGAIHTYTIGFAALAASRAGWHAPEDGHDIELGTHLAAYTTPRQFAAGLDFLLEGISLRTQMSGTQ
jgi:TetR/AcrR family tetracycline transcriptional repressor